MRRGPSDVGGAVLDEFLLGMAALSALFCGYRLVLCAFVYRDAGAKGADSMSWAGLVSVLGIIGLVVWLAARPSPVPAYRPRHAYYQVPGQYPPGEYVYAVTYSQMGSRPPPAQYPPAGIHPPAGYAPPPTSPAQPWPYQPSAYSPPAPQYPPPWLPPYAWPQPSGAPTAAPARPAWRPFAVHRMLSTFFAAMAVTVFIELPLIFLVMALGSGGSTDPAVLVSQLLSPGLLLVFVAIQDAILVGFTYIAMFRPGHISLKDMGATAEANLPRGALVGALCGLAMFAVVSGLGWLLERTGWFGAGEGLIQVGTPAGLVLTLVATVAIAPPAEELFFRGYALPVLERRWGPTAGVALSALMFSAVHGNLYQLAPIFLAGVMLALLYRKWGIVPCIAAHGVNNFLAVVLLYLGFG